MKKTIILLCMILTGCSYFDANHNIYKSRPNAYIQAKNINVLTVPSGLSKPERDEQFYIPPGTIQANPKDHLLPPGSLAEHIHYTNKR